MSSTESETQSSMSDRYRQELRQRKGKVKYPGRLFQNNEDHEFEVVRANNNLFKCVLCEYENNRLLNLRRHAAKCQGMEEDQDEVPGNLRFNLEFC